MAQAVLKLNEKRNYTNHAVKTILSHREKMKKKAYTITDRADREFTVRFTLDECGCSEDDPDFDSKIKLFVANVLSSRGYNIVDPESLTFTNLDIRNNGECVATIRSSVLKDYSATSSRSGGEAPVSTCEVIATSEALSKRRRNRENLLRMAQIMPGGNAPMSANQGQGAEAIPTNTDAAGGEGIASFTSPTNMDNDNDFDDDDNNNIDTNANKQTKTLEESLPTPGTIQPPGSICPACGSIDVDLVDARGKCNSCGTEYEMVIDIKILNYKQQDEKNQSLDNSIDELQGFGPEGAAPIAPENNNENMMQETPALQATQPTGAAAAATSSAPPQMAFSRRKKVFAASAPLWVKLSWLHSPDVFLKTAAIYENGNDPADFPIGEELAVGHVCPACGDKKSLIRREAANKKQTNVFCDECGTVSVVTISPASGNNIISSIEYQL